MPYASPGDPAFQQQRNSLHNSGDALSIAEEIVVELAPLESRIFAVPVEGIDMEDVPDTFGDPRSGKRAHQATDIPAPEGTPVIAVENATVARMVNNRLGGITIYLLEPSDTYYYYYAHLRGYADGLEVGDQVEQGQVIGYVGTTGNAPANVPHLHFEINEMGADKRVTGGTPVNPYPLLMHSAE